MAAPKGNVYWKLANGFAKGSDRSYTPNDLWEKALEYFKWAENHPLKEEKVFGTGFKATINKMRAMTIAEFCVFAGIGRTTFRSYSQQDAYKLAIDSLKDKDKPKWVRWYFNL